MKILIISDAGKPQINGVVRTLEATAQELQRMGHETLIVTPDHTRLFTVRVPFYPEIYLEFFAGWRLREIIKSFSPDFIHIATEGPLGWSARCVCLHQARPFTTSYHTRFPEYLAARSPRILRWFVQTTAYSVLRRFHAPASVTMVATASIENELRKHRFYHLVRWSRGVDSALFCPAAFEASVYQDMKRPILLYVGRVAVEKNIVAFLELESSGSLVVIGDGPDREALAQRYPKAYFLGAMKSPGLAAHYAAADLFVFPSTTDTFGLVLLEACASGLRIAAKPVPGPVDLFKGEETPSFAVLDEDLGQAVEQALRLPREPSLPQAFAARFSWQVCTQQFVNHLQAPSAKATRRLQRWRKKIGDRI